LFPEQAVNWSLMSRLIEGKKDIKVLNLFVYTGAATLACAAAGAQVTHVDASKGMVLWAKDNAVASGLADRPIRWLVDDCIKFVRREIRRGNKYDGIVMDPPSYGRGPNGEVWRLEEQIYELLQLCDELLSDKPLFFVLNSYTTGLSPCVMKYLVTTVISSKRGGTVECDEIGLPVTSTGMALPCGNTAVWRCD
ncbi:MAG: class I SAM-dependent methyltransferase, partial [Clostridia bacterium]|nr:class I SAM-dependent methyltransferase [Clostridia bacterium]